MLGGLLLSALTLLQASLCDAGGGEQARVVTARAGDTVWLDAQLPTESVTTARWKYRGKDVSGFEGCFPVQEDPKFLHFNGRAQMDNISLNLLVRNVTPEDAGNFSFISALNSSQRKTVFITLRVYEPIATPFVLVVNSSWHAANGTCAVLLRCSTSPDRDVAYNWTIGKETYVGATVNYAANYTLQPEEEEPTAWCTASNPVSLGSASTPVTCSNSSHSIQKESATEVLYIVVATVIGVLTLIVAGLGIAFGLRRRAGRML